MFTRGFIRAALGAALLTACPLGATPALAAGPPQVDAAWVTDVTASSANLHGQVNPNGLATAYRFEYITEAAYRENLAASRQAFAGATRAPATGEANLGAAETDQPALEHVERLTPATAYRYRLVATNAAAPEGIAGPTHALTTQASAAAGREECPNARLRGEDNSLSLPDCRAYELVSPVDKNGGAVAFPGSLFGGGVLQVAASGEAATFSSSASFGAEAQGAPSASQYISSRTPAGWQTVNITQPTLSGAYGDHPEGVPYQLFSGDLARGLLLDGRRCAEGEACPRSYSLRDSASGTLTPLPAQAAGMRVLGASPDLGRILFEDEAREIFAWSGAGLVPTSLLPPSAGPGAVFQTASGRFTLYTEGGHLYRYDAASEAATDLTPPGGVVGVLGASEDEQVVYYQAAAGLFRWEEGKTTELAAGAGAAQASDWPPSSGTARVSPDGSRLAFLSASPALAEAAASYDNTDAASPEPCGKPKGVCDAELYLFDATANGGTGALDCVSCNPTGERPLGPASIPGAVPNGEGPLATDSYKPRDLAANGGRLFFDSADQILSQDTSAAADAYEWEAPGEGGCRQGAPAFYPTSGGCLFLLSSGRSAQASTFVDASADGSDALFLTADSLLGRDPGSYDLYDARALGGFPEPEAPIPCEEDACQPVPSPPEDPLPGTLVPGPPNPPVRFPKPPKKCPKGTRRVVKHGKTRCARKRQKRGRR